MSVVIYQFNAYLTHLSALPLASPTDPPRAPTTPEAAVPAAPAPDIDTNLPAGPPTPDGDVGMFAPADDETHEREANKDDEPSAE
jgi:hypothetical protein